MNGEPYCGNCDYSLVGLTESSRCPECGKPLVEVLQRRGQILLRGKRYRSELTIFGTPFVHIAYGPDGTERRGIARGIIAIGDIAFGVVAIGRVFSCGVMAMGAISLGVAALGGGAVGLIAFGGWAIGGVSLAGASLGLIAMGGAAVGLVAIGGGAVGYYAFGGGCWGRHVIDAVSRDPAAVEFLHRWEWFFGPNAAGRPAEPLLAVLWVFIAWIGVGILTAIGVGIAYLLDRRRQRRNLEMR